jgi:excisionase family DNA binding protein
MDNGMMEHMTPAPGQEPPHLLSIAEAARRLGVSTRTVYGYLEQGKLTRVWVEGLSMLLDEEVASFRRRAPGRMRTVAPRWRLPPEHNPMYLTTIHVRVRPGGEALLEEIIEDFRVAKRHQLEGTSARYIGRIEEDPALVVMLLLWRGAGLPPEELRQRAIEAFSADLSQALDWSTADIVERRVLLHAG